MGKRGPAPKPTELKKLEGNPGKRALNTHEPQYIGRLPGWPRELRGEKAALKEYRRVCRLLVASRVATEADWNSLVALCMAWQDVMTARERMASPTFERVRETAQGYEYANPWIGIHNTALKQYRGLAAEFGLTPASRTRIQTPAVTEEDEFAAFLGRRNGDGMRDE